MLLFPWNWDNFLLRCWNNTIYRTTLMDEWSNVSNTITSLKQNNHLNVILYWDKKFNSNKNQSMMGTKTVIGIAIKVYSPQPSNLSDTLNQFVIFKPLSYYFKETIGFDVKATFESPPVSILIRRYNKPIHNKRVLIKGYLGPRDFSWIENYKLKLKRITFLSNSVKNPR